MTHTERAQIVKRLAEVVERRFVDPSLNGLDFRATLAESRADNADDGDEFERLVNAALQRLGTSHVGFFRGERPRISGRISISATFLRHGDRWLFQDVHPGGVAANAGIAPGDALLAIDGRDAVAHDPPAFSLGCEHQVDLRTRSGEDRRLTLSIPASSDRKRPLIVPSQVVTSRRLDERTGYLKISMFPGALGIDVARDIQQAARDLATQRLIIDLRGNSGGGMGCLRLMSLLCPDRRGVGYSVGRAHFGSPKPDKHRLPYLDSIPDSKFGILPIAARLAFSRRSVAVYTEALGVQPFHGSIAMLVNEHSASASEMVAAFAQEGKLATLIGTKTPGKLVAATSFKVGHGYRVALPVAHYFTWSGNNLESTGVTPEIIAPATPESLIAGADLALEAALEHAGSL